MKRLRLVAAVASGGLLALGVGTTGAGPAVTGCTTHQCDGDTICIDSVGNAKAIHDPSECTPLLPDGVPVPNYNLKVEAIGSTGTAGDTELVWDTSSFLGPWLDFEPQRTFIVQFPPGLVGHVPHSFDGWVSSDNDAEAGASHQNFTNTAGQLLEYTFVNETQVHVYNNTCVDYALRFEVRAFASSAETGAPQAGDADADADADAGASIDAGSLTDMDTSADAGGE